MTSHNPTRTPAAPVCQPDDVRASLFQVVAKIEECSNGMARRIIWAGAVSVDGYVAQDENQLVAPGTTLQLGGSKDVRLTAEMIMDAVPKGARMFAYAPAQPNEVSIPAFSSSPISEEDIEKLQFAAVYDGILLTRSAILQGAVKCDDLPQVVSAELARIFPQKSVPEYVLRLCQQAGLSEILSREALHQLQTELSQTLSSRLARLRPGDVRTEVLIDWCSQQQSSESSSVGVVEGATLDGAGRGGNTAACNAAECR